MKRTLPPLIKIYEALWCIGDGRLELLPIVESATGGVIEAKVYSSDKSKYYTVTYAESQHAIMSNDNGSYRVGYVGYPSIALLLFLDILDYRSEYGEALADIPRKLMNTANNNDFDRTQAQVDEKLRQAGIDLTLFHAYAQELLVRLGEMNLEYLGEKKKL